MDKRIGSNLDSIEHAMFNWPRPTPRCAKLASQFNRASVRLLYRADMLFDQALHMRASTRRIVFQAAVVFLILLWAPAIAPEPPVRISISRRDLVRAVTIGRSSLIDLCLIEQADPNGRDTHGRTPLLIATSRQEWTSARRLIGAVALFYLVE